MLHHPHLGTIKRPLPILATVSRTGSRFLHAGSSSQRAAGRDNPCGLPSGPGSVTKFFLEKVAAVELHTLNDIQGSVIVLLLQR